MGAVEKRRIQFSRQTDKAFMLKHTIPSLMFSQRALGAQNRRRAPCPPARLQKQFLKSDQQRAFRGRDVWTLDPMARSREDGGIS